MGPLVPCSRWLCSRIVLGRAGAPVCCSIFERVHRTENNNNTHHGFQKNLLHTIAAHRNHGHTHRGTATVLLTLPAHVVQSCWQCCDFTGSFINPRYHNRCKRRNSALLLRSSSRLQLQHSLQRRRCISTSSEKRTNSCKPRPRS